MEDMDKLHKTLLNMMDTLDKYFNDNGIKYYLSWGSLLGAIRDKSIIKWDDDMDLMLTRDNYNKLMTCWKDNHPSELFLQNINTDKDIYFRYSKIRLNDTVFYNDFEKNLDMHKGIFIDIFVLDNMPNDIKEDKKYLKELTYINRCYKYLTLHKYSLLHLFVNRENLLAKADKLVNKYKDSNRYLDSTQYEWKEDYRSIYNKDLFNETIKVSLDNHFYNAPSGYDKILTTNYGEYHKLPKKSKQKPKHHVYLKFDK